MLKKQSKDKKLQNNPTTTRNEEHRKIMEERKLALGHFGGRPAKYKTVKQLEKVIDEYFDVFSSDKNILKLYNRKGDEIGWDFKKVPTVTGLALYLGFQSRQSLIDYDEKPEFSDTIKKAKLFLENFNEERLLQGKGYGPGIMFNLKNNFNWKDKTEVDSVNSGEITFKIKQ